MPPAVDMQVDISITSLLVILHHVLTCHVYLYHIPTCGYNLQHPLCSLVANRHHIMSNG